MDKNIGKKLDNRYELLELIGVGGMADIYKAIPPQHSKDIRRRLYRENPVYRNGIYRRNYPYGIYRAAGCT